MVTHTAFPDPKISLSISPVSQDLPFFSCEDPAPPGPALPIVTFCLRIKVTHVCETGKIIKFKRWVRLKEGVQAIKSWGEQSD
jgi:hypothetical protein